MEAGSDFKQLQQWEWEKLQQFVPDPKRLPSYAQAMRERCFWCDEEWSPRVRQCGYNKQMLLVCAACVTLPELWDDPFAVQSRLCKLRERYRAEYEQQQQTAAVEKKAQEEAAQLQRRKQQAAVSTQLANLSKSHQQQQDRRLQRERLREKQQATAIAAIRQQEEVAKAKEEKKSKEKEAAEKEHAKTAREQAEAKLTPLGVSLAYKLIELQQHHHGFLLGSSEEPNGLDQMHDWELVLRRWWFFLESYYRRDVPGIHITPNQMSAVEKLTPEEMKCTREDCWVR